MYLTSIKLAGRLKEGLSLPGIAKGEASFGLKALAAFLAAFLLFNNGFVYEVTNSPHSYFTLDSNVDSTKYSAAEVAGANWLYHYHYESLRVYADSHRWFLLAGFFKGGSRITGKRNEGGQLIVDSEFLGPGYIYLGRTNLKDNRLLVVRSDLANPHGSMRLAEYADLQGLGLLESRNLIYSNGEARLFR